MLKDIKAIAINNGDGIIVYKGNGAITILESLKELEDSISSAKSIWINKYDVKRLRDFLNNINLD